MAEIYYYYNPNQDVYLCRNWDFVLPDLTGGATVIPEGAAESEYDVTTDSQPSAGTTYYVYISEYSLASFDSEDPAFDSEVTYYVESGDSYAAVPSNASYDSSVDYYIQNSPNGYIEASLGSPASFASGETYYVLEEPEPYIDNETLTYDVDFNTAYYLTRDFWEVLKNVNDNTDDFEDILKTILSNNEAIEDSSSSKITMNAALEDTYTVTSEDTITVNGTTMSGYEGVLTNEINLPLISYNASDSRIDNGFRKYTITASGSGAQPGSAGTEWVPPSE